MITDITPLLGKIHNVDCLPFLGTLPDSCIDAVVTDPPYGLSFMGKHWDYDVPQVPVFTEMLRVLKPGGHLLCFGGSRTFHRIAVNIEDAGFDIRDTLMWLYGSGFPKSHDVSKGIDKAAGVTRKIQGYTANARPNRIGKDTKLSGKQTIGGEITFPASDTSLQWQGWGTALKPAHEPIIMARKPLEGTVAANVLEYGTGAINIDGCRVGNEAHIIHGKEVGNFQPGSGSTQKDYHEVLGRWPANVIHDGSEEVTAGFPDSGAGNGKGAYSYAGKEYDNKDTSMFNGDKPQAPSNFNDSGSAARFFYCAKTSKTDRNEGCEGLETKEVTSLGNYAGTDEHGPKQNVTAKNNHPTVKPTALMAYLCRLITPPNGIILDPYSGSGSTGKAATLEGFRFIGMEREAEYCTIANARIAWAANEKVEIANKRIEAERAQLKLF